MHVILPPSETKRSGGGDVYLPESLSHHTELSAARRAVLGALERLCATDADEDRAAKVLGLGVKARAELRHNRVIRSSGAMPAIERYTGVLYDALDAQHLDGAARAWLDAHVSVQSSLFGLISAGDQIPAYRLSGGTRLSELIAPLKTVWREAHATIDLSSYGWVLDLRSKDYVALAPLPSGMSVSYLHVAQRGPDGAARALNHFNKAAKGDLVRRLAQSDARLESADDFIAWAKAEGLEVERGVSGAELTLLTELAPAGAGRSAARSS